MIRLIETAVEALKKGAYDYLKKPVNHELLFSTIGQAIKHGRLEKALKVSEERSKTLAEASWEGIVIHSNGRMLDGNKQFFEMFGYQPVELLDKQILDMILSVTAIPDVNLRIKNKTFGCYKSLGLRKDGTEFPIETSSRRISYKGEDARVCAIRDISQRVRADQEKLELQKQLAIASKMETLGLMAGSVAHDLNNILSGIVTLPELLLMQMEEDNEYRDTIQLIREAGKEASSVVSDLMTVARGATAEKDVCNLNTVVENLITKIKKKKLDSRVEGIAINVYCEAGYPNSYCSVVHINKVLMNLIGNAAEELEGKGTIVVRTRNVFVEEPHLGYERVEAGEYIVVSVTDSGSGIEEEDLKKIFEPFYSKKVMGRSGTGLGLAIVWNVVHDHYGFIDLKSDEHGTTFDLYFPTTEAGIKNEMAQSSIGNFKGSGESILVIDDQGTQQEIARKILTALGYKVHTVASGDEAIAFTKTNRVDLLILDMIMADGLDGREIYEEILKINPKQRAIIASGFAENNEVERTIMLGASQFIKKPYTLVQIGQAVKLALL